MTLVAFLKSRAEKVITYGGATGIQGSEPQIPAAQTDPATNITWTGATLHATVNGQNQDTTVQFEYGATTAYGKITPIQNLSASELNQSVSAQVKGLVASTTYHYRVRAANAAGQTFGLDDTFRTQGVGGVTPSIVGTPPIVDASGVTALDYDGVSGQVTATLHGTVDCGSHTLQTTYQFWLREAGIGATWNAVNSPGTTSSTSPVTVSEVTGYVLAPGRHYEYVLRATNIKGEVESAPPFAFDTPAAPPPVGVAPTGDTLSAANVTSNGALVTVEVNNVNTTAGTGWTDVWLRYSLAGAHTNYTQVGPINLAPLTGNTLTQFSYPIAGLTASTGYDVWVYASNPYGSVSDDATPVNFTTSAAASLGTIAMTVDTNWVAYGQATVFCFYTTPGAGTFSIRFGYREFGVGSFTYTSYESVAATTAGRAWDAVIGGLTPSTQYEVHAQLYDTVNTVTSDTATITTLGAPSATANGYTSNFPGKGPGSRGTPSAAAGQTPTISDIATYADPRRPSSGLITETNERQFKPNIAADPTYGPAMIAHYTGLGLLNNPDGYDIFVYGSGHAIGGYTTYDIEVWDPKLVVALGGTTPPLVIPNANHGKNSQALIHAIKAFARHSDVVGGVGSFAELKWTGAGSTNAGADSEICWVTATNLRKTVVGVSIVGGVAVGSANQLYIDKAISFGSRLGAITNVHFKNLYGRGVSSGNQFFAYTANGGSNVTGSWTFNGLVGLHGAYACKVETFAASADTDQFGWGLQHCLRTFCASTRLDFRDNEFQWCREHQFYVDNPSPPQAGTEAGVAAPSFFLRNTGIAGLSFGPKTGCSKPWYQQVARYRDKSTANDCPTACGGCGTCNHSIGPNGEGDIYVIDNDSYGQAGTTHDIQITGHHGRVIIKAINQTAALFFGGQAGCCDGFRPVNGNDGYLYATKEVIIRDWHTALNTIDENSALKLDSVMRVEIQDISVPVGFNRYLMCIATGGFSNVKYNGVSVNCCGFVKATMNNPLSAWGGWNGGAYSTGEFRFAYKDGGSQSMNDTTTLPILSGHAYTITEVDAFYNGVCRLDFPAPPAGGSVGCLNDPA